MRRWLYIAALCLPWLAWSAPTHYMEVTIDSTLVDEAIPVIPVFLSPGDTTFWTTVTGANDVVPYDSTGATVLDFYRVSFTDAGSTGTGLLLVNVDGIISASSDGTFRIYFGDASATDQSDGAATFTGTSYEAYYCLNSLTDLTGNGNNLSATNAPTSGQSTAFEGLEGYLFDDASSQYLSSAISISAWPVTIESINSPDTESGQWTAIALADSSDNVDKMRLRAVGDAPNDPYYGYVLGASGASITMPGTVVNYAANSWYYGAMTQAASSGSALYVNGGLEDTDATAVTDPAFDIVAIGISPNLTQERPFSGKIAMGAVSTVERSADFIATVYNSWTDAGFLTVGASTAISTPTSATGYFQTASTTAASGDIDWSSTANATGSDSGTYANATLNDELSYALLLTNADLSDVPDAATITSIQIDVYHSASGSGKIRDNLIYMAVAGSSFGADKHVTTQWSTGEVSYTWTSGFPSVAQVKASTFGLYLQCYESDAASKDARVHYGRVTVNFTTGAAADTTSFFAFF